MSSIFFQKQSNDSYRFTSELMDILMAGVHQQPDQSNYLAKGQILTCKLSLALLEGSKSRSASTPLQEPALDSLCFAFHQNL